jgi:glycerol-3-phosphate dehydrogenase (NAD(P)+)
MNDVNNEKFKSIGVIGAGAWGTALAQLFSQNVEKVYLYDRNVELIKSINEVKKNNVHFPEITLNENIEGISDLEKLSGLDLILLVVPSQIVRTVLSKFKNQKINMPNILICAKGIENNSLKLMHQVVGEFYGDSQIAILSGPNFAEEIMVGQPSATTIASQNIEFAKRIVFSVSNPRFKAYYSSDIVGVQVTGAVKNVVAIASGIASGLGFLENARAALITRGISEITLLNQSLGGNPITLLGLSGVGDLFLTCSSTKSRNMSFGFQIGKRAKVDDLIFDDGKTIEGYFTAKSIYELGKNMGLEMPICESVYKILYNKLNVMKAVEELLNRPIKINEFNL